MVVNNVYILLDIFLRSSVFVVDVWRFVVLFFFTVIFVQSWSVFPLFPVSIHYQYYFPPLPTIGSWIHLRFLDMCYWKNVTNVVSTQNISPLGLEGVVQYSLWQLTEDFWFVETACHSVMWETHTEILRLIFFFFFFCRFGSLCTACVYEMEWVRNQACYQKVVGSNLGPWQDCGVLKILSHLILTIWDVLRRR